MCIKTREVFEFLDGALDGWPDWSAPKKTSAKATSNIEKDESVNNEETDGTVADVMEDPAKNYEEVDADEQEASGDDQDTVPNPEVQSHFWPLIS